MPERSSASPTSGTKQRRRKATKLVDAASRCIAIRDNPAAQKVTEVCSGRYEFLPDSSWKATGTCTDTFQGGDTLSVSWEEGSHLKEFTYKKFGGTGKYKGATGTGTYTIDNLTKILSGGRYKGTIELP